jgi:hypothetical protein
MKNTLPKTVSDLLTTGEKAADALHTHESNIGIMHNTESVVRERVIDARESNSAFQAAKAVKLAAADAQNTADANAVAFITTARDVLKPRLGTTYSQAWAEAGFASNTLGIPGTLSKRMEALKSLELYFTAHAAHEVAALNVTAARAVALHTALSNAVSALNAARGTQRAKRENRDGYVTRLYKRLRALMGELEDLMGEEDPRWFDFGFRIPTDEQVPEVPAELTVVAGAPGHLVADWPPSGRASRYHVYKQVIGVDDDFVLAKTVTDSDADLNTFASGSNVRVRVTALNDSGESQPSEVVEQAVP